MFFYALGVTLYVFLGLFLILIILVQKGRGSAGLGALGGGAQILFGGSGGQELFQKITWATATLFIALSLSLALSKRSLHMQVNYKTPEIPVHSPVQSQPTPVSQPAAE